MSCFPRGANRARIAEAAVGTPRAACACRTLFAAGAASEETRLLQFAEKESINRSAAGNKSCESFFSFRMFSSFSDTRLLAGENLGLQTFLGNVGSRVAVAGVMFGLFIQGFSATLFRSDRFSKLSADIC